MSVAFDISPPPPADGDNKRSSALLAEPIARDDVRRSLVAMLRRRVPGQDVEDLAQTILCDALAANAMPTDENELRAWLNGIARHKIADFHRRAYRVTARSDGDAPLATCTTSPAAFEEREVLQHLLGEVRSRRDAVTMEWLVREHGGERLADIAEENALPAEVVRQRVSRLRRALRSRWAMAVGLIVLLAGAAAWAFSRETVATKPIVPEKPPLIVELPAITKRLDPRPAYLDEIQGSWIGSAYEFPQTVPTKDQKLITDYGTKLKVNIDGDRVTIRVGSLFSGAWAITGTDGSDLLLTSDLGMTDRATVKVKHERGSTYVEIRIAGHPRLPTVVHLKRPVY